MEGWPVEYEWTRKGVAEGSTTGMDFAIAMQCRYEAALRLECVMTSRREVRLVRLWIWRVVVLVL
jgi:hypothetical protein